MPSGAAGGTVEISETTIAETPPSGFDFLGQEVVITAPAATATNPLILTFNLHTSIAGTDPNAIEMFKAGVLVGACTGNPGEASPDPCVTSRALVVDNIQIVVLTSTASAWNFGEPTATATPTATPAPAPPLTDGQRSCVNEMNKNGRKVNSVQLKENQRCLKDFQRGKLSALRMTFDACTTADRKNRVKKAMEKTAARQNNKCDPPKNVPPPFAYTGAATVNKAAVDGALALTHAIFGAPTVLDADLVTRAADKETARCQLEMFSRARKLESTALKEVNKAKRGALKDETVNSDTALEAKLQAVFSRNDKIDKFQNGLVNGVDNKCVFVQIPDLIFPGYDCGKPNPNLRDVEDCVIAAARCGACLKINAFDDLNLDCDQADDRTANDSCP